MEEKKVIFSGIQPSGTITLGNYLGAVKNWVELQDEYNCLYSVVDMHSITVRQNPAELRKRCVEFLCMFMACGLDPEKNIMYFQSHVSAHAELAWVLNCYTYMGELSRMTQFKDKSAKHSDNINAGLFTYPVLMAADILLYQTDLVPVGVDQKQHIEITRDIASRFNALYGDVFKIPEPYIPKVGAKIMSLTEPTKKMSKSDPNPKGFISLMDDSTAIAKKIKGAVTDSDGRICRGEGKEGIENLMNILSSTTGESIESIEERFAGRGYGEFKSEVAEAVVECLRPVKARYDEYIKDKAYVESVYKKGAEQASRIAYKTLNKVYKKVGFVPRAR
ncbi:MAG TPA: tryptophan--tRNA ligase [Candidatus Aphodoplasma excrementigallinarum]|uniref:Tryptophan--tRNA ligase n=1 Tax=Candidatus Aphodoplasma excrementigallinarum TaxID=2840673 RepID=A0A9D1SZ30_9FIRM|nr:tryptophan--tRNA ligase [Candidatus Aphodoplasma excrementigallinarum]